MNNCQSPKNTCAANAAQASAMAGLYEAAAGRRDLCPEDRAHHSAMAAQQRAAEAAYLRLAEVASERVPGGFLLRVGE